MIPRNLLNLGFTVASYISSSTINRIVIRALEMEQAKHPQVLEIVKTSMSGERWKVTGWDTQPNSLSVTLEQPVR